MIERLKNGEGKVAVIGLGYVGLPLAEALVEHFQVVGFDISEEKVERISKSGTAVPISSDPNIMAGAICFIIAVPTPIDENNLPVLDPLVGASVVAGRYVKPGDYVVYESTVFPGCTEEVCVPILEEQSGLKAIEDFKVCYTPERISPGEDSKDIQSIVKVISACDEEALNELEALYTPITSDTCRAASIRVAEMSKLVENVQRDVNISLINEFAMICDRLGIDTHDVLDVASTKWNFQRYYPGLVGGHCISVDPYYLVYKSQQLGHAPRVILSGRDINDKMPSFIGKKLVQKLIKYGKNPGRCRALVLGITFKPNIDDIRNSKVVDLIRELQAFAISVDTVDPLARKGEVLHEYGIELKDEPTGIYDAIVIAVPHADFLSLNREFFEKHLDSAAVVMDIGGKFKELLGDTDYWRL